MCKIAKLLLPLKLTHHQDIGEQEGKITDQII